MDLLGVELSATMFAVTSGYSTSENDFFFQNRRHLAEFEVADNWLKTEGSFVYGNQRILLRCVARVTSRGDLIDAPLSCQVVSQICRGSI